MSLANCVRSALVLGFVAGAIGCAADEGAEPERNTAADSIKATFVSVDASGKPTLRVDVYTRADFDAMVAARREHLAENKAAGAQNDVSTAKQAVRQTTNCDDWSSLWLYDAGDELFCFEGAAPNPFDLATVSGFDLPVTRVWPGNVLGGYIGVGEMWCNGGGADICDFWREYTEVDGAYPVQCNTSQRMVISPITCFPT